MAEQSQGPVFAIQRVYLKDLSLEIPHAPHIFLEQKGPEIEIQLDVGGEALADGIYESAVTVTVTAKVGDKTLFLVEAKEAGIFEIRGIPEDQLPMLLNIVCPNVIYPYLRSNIADTIQRTGLPPVHLAEINFEALYQQRLQQEEARKAGNGGSGIILPPGAA
ncbi:MAG: protein-export chaperone SecB [Burkholderiaceae bacterium]|jgi:preprotein translocase subunit SecB|nr:protein-export chaperone SecB [Burkholderiaceae bacterium]